MTVEANEELGFAADSRDYAFSAAALKLLGVRRVRLLSNNPDKVQQLEDAGVRLWSAYRAGPEHQPFLVRTWRRSARRWGIYSIVCSLGYESETARIKKRQHPRRYLYKNRGALARVEDVPEWVAGTLPRTRLRIIRSGGSP